MQFPWSRHGGNRVKHHNTMETREKLFRKEFTETMDSHQKQNGPKKSKRFRSAFTTDQVNHLEMEFKKSPYIGNNQRKEMATILNIPERAIKIWFQNRRMKEKKDVVGSTESDEKSDRNTVDLCSNDKVTKTALSLPPISVPPSMLPEPAETPSVNPVAHIDLSSFEPNSGEESDTQKVVSHFYSDLISPLPEVSISRIPKSQPSRPPIVSNPHLKYRSSAEFSINLCKKYKTFGANKLQNKTEEVSLQPLPSTPLHEQSRSKVRKFEYQSSPEDLSCNKSSVPKIQALSPQKQLAPTSPGLIPVYVNYPQPYLSAGNMVWKPVNVMPIMSTGLPAVNVPNIPPGPMHRLQEQSTVKKKCNCDCHLDATAIAVPLPDRNTNSQPQYMITALPFQGYP